MTTGETTSRLTPRQREGRAINAVAELLRRTLSVPNIYLEPPSSLIAADVLAVDRGGAGDLHAVQIKLEPNLNPSENGPKKPSSPKELTALKDAWHAKFDQKIQGIHRQLMAMSAHYRYLAIPVESLPLALGALGPLGLFPQDGIGRLGIIAIKDMGEQSPKAEIEIAPERFRMDSTKLKAIENRLLAKSRPDIEVRI